MWGGFFDAALNRIRNESNRLRVTLKDAEFERKHPRHRAGAPEGRGGEFAPRGAVTYSFADLTAYNRSADKFKGTDEGNSVVARRNEERNGIELKFANKPSDEILRLVSNNGFKWGSYNGVWYKRFGETEWKLAQEFAERYNKTHQGAGASPVEPTQATPPNPVKPIEPILTKPIEPTQSPPIETVTAPAPVKPTKPITPNPVQPQPTPKPKPVKPKSPAPHTGGKNISDLLSYNSDLGREYRWLPEVGKYIDAVHGVGETKPIPVILNRMTRAHGEFTAYASGEPISISVSRNSEHPELTLAHEIGHYVDGFALNGNTTFRGYASNSPEMTELMGEWRAAVEKSWAIQEIKRLRGAGFAEVKIGSGRSQSTYEYPIDRQYLNYLLKPEEVFARSYAQYIATRSDEPRLTYQLIKKLRVPQGGVYYPSQWDEEDFEPIAKAFDKIFEAKGWLRWNKPKPKPKPRTSAKSALPYAWRSWA